jgi:hypothetical protein
MMDDDRGRLGAMHNPAHKAFTGPVPEGGRHGRY